MRRVLKPDGELYFSEHGRAPDASVARLQDRASPYWRKFAGGCELNRDIPRLLREAGFELVDLETMYVPRTPRIMGHTFWGRARRRRSQLEHEQAPVGVAGSNAHEPKVAALAARGRRTDEVGVGNVDGR